VLRDTGMHDLLLRMGHKVAETMVELFSGLPPGHEFFAQYSFIRQEDLPQFDAILKRVGEVGLRGLQLSRINKLDMGDLQVRNLPVLIKNPALRGIPKREGESFSPLSFGMSMLIDYQHRTLTMARTLPSAEANDLRLPMRVHRLAMVRGMLNSTRPTYFVVDTGGEVISISAETASRFDKGGYRKIPLKVYGTSGWDRDAFLLPGMSLNFDQIEYKNMPLVVLNLRAPSVLLGFQLGGIVGHNFLSHYKVALDVEQSELRLQKF
jgi:hypothetical protein